MRTDRKSRISGLAGTEHARNRFTRSSFRLTVEDLGTRLESSVVLLAAITSNRSTSRTKSLNSTEIAFIPCLFDKPTVITVCGFRLADRISTAVLKATAA